MSTVLNGLREWVDPSSSRHRVVPPMDRGLRPNLRLDQAAELLDQPLEAPDAVVRTTDGGLVVSDGTRLLVVEGRACRVIAGFGGAVTALSAYADGVLAAVDGHGLVAVAPGGAVADVCVDPLVGSCVTDLAVLLDGTVLASIGSRRNPITQWSRSLIEGDASGELVRVVGSTATVVADRLAWPSGVCGDGADHVLLSISLEHRVERRGGDLRRPGEMLTVGLPVYPGRIRRAAEGFWIAAPYVRNRVTEMLLDERRLLEEMTATISPEQWFVPRLQAGNPFTDTMQMGQLRVLGVVKSWAPARSCGLVFRIDHEGRVVESAHARVDSARHGVTDVLPGGDGLVVVGRGHGNLLKLEEDR